MHGKLSILAPGIFGVLAVAIAVSVAVASPIPVSLNANIDDLSHPYNGPGAVSNGTDWNQVTTASGVGYGFGPTNASQYYFGGLLWQTGPLNDSSGNPTSVTFSTDGSYTNNPGQNISMNDGLLYGASFHNELLSVPAGTYDLYVYASFSTNTSVITVNSGTPQSVISDGMNDSTFLPGTNYTEFANISPDGSGTITFNIATGGAGNAVLGGFQLVPVVSVPEPSSLVLAGLGLVCAMLWARSRR